MTTFRLARSPTTSLVGVVRGNTNLQFPIGGGGGGTVPAWLQVPTQVDEQLMYDNVLNWDWIPADKATDFATTAPVLSSDDIHNETEADDLWNHYQAWKRTKDSNPTAAAVHLSWANAWRNYWVTGPGWSDLQTDGANFTWDHLYGWGLCMWGAEQNDAAALSMAGQIAAKVEEIVGTPGNYQPGYGNLANSAMAYNGARRQARKLIFLCHYAAVNPITRWIQLRDRMIDLWVNSKEWEDTVTYTTPSPCAAGGMYYFGRDQTLDGSDMTGTAAYDAGLRMTNSWMTGIMINAFWLAYKATGRSDVRGKIVKMAEFVRHYIWNPSHVNAMVGTYFGHYNGGYYHRRGGTISLPSGGDAHTDPNTAPTDSYDISLVNALVYGYKLTGDVSFLNKAKQVFRQATCYTGATGAGRPKLAQNEVHHYMDTKRKTPETKYFNYNKGEIQYAFAIAENAGVPAVEGAWVIYDLRPTQPGQVVKIAGDAVPTTDTKKYTNNDLTGSAFPTNCAGDVGPTEFGSSLKCNDMWWGGDTRTKFIESYSRGGAVVIAGSGGHGGGQNYGAMLFDFEDARFKRIWTTQGNPGVDNIAGTGPNPIDMRTNTRIHGCKNYLRGNTEYFINSGHDDKACWNPAHWASGGATGQQLSDCPLTPDPRDQFWEVSREWSSGPVQGQTDPLHATPFTEAEFNRGGLQNGMWPRNGYITRGTTRFPDTILPGTLEPTQSGIPGPGHIWDHYYELKPSEGGGPRGSIVTGRHANIGEVGVSTCNWSHRFDLHTGIWHEFSINAPVPASGAPTPPAGGGPTAQPDAIGGAEDKELRRVYLIAKEGGGSRRLNYMNLADRTWRNFDVGTGGGTPERLTEYMVVDPVRRLLILIADETPHLWAVDLQTVGKTGTPEPTPSHALGGWKIIPYDDIPGVQNGSPWISSPAPGFPHGGQVRMPWRYYPPNGKFYRVNPRYPGGGFQAPPPTDLTFQITVLQRLTPPPAIATPRPDFYYTTEASSGRWTLDEVTLDTPLPIPTSGITYAACGFSWFHYVPSLECFAFWPADDGVLKSRRCVYLIKPE